MYKSLYFSILLCKPLPKILHVFSLAKQLKSELSCVCVSLFEPQNSLLVHVTAFTEITLVSVSSFSKSCRHSCMYDLWYLCSFLDIPENLFILIILWMVWWWFLLVSWFSPPYYPTGSSIEEWLHMYCICVMPTYILFTDIRLQRKDDKQNQVDQGFPLCWFVY